MNKLEYFHINSEYIGNRYFKVDFENKRVIQILLEKPNKNSIVHCVGIYFITWSSFTTNYYNRRDSKICPLKYTSKNQYEKIKQQLLNKLS